MAYRSRSTGKEKERNAKSARDFEGENEEAVGLLTHHVHWVKIRQKVRDGSKVEGEGEAASEEQRSSVGLLLFERDGEGSLHDDVLSRDRKRDAGQPELDQDAKKRADTHHRLVRNLPVSDQRIRVCRHSSFRVGPHPRGNRRAGQS